VAFTLCLQSRLEPLALGVKRHALARGTGVQLPLAAPRDGGHGNRADHPD